MKYFSAKNFTKFYITTLRVAADMKFISIYFTWISVDNPYP